MGPVEPERILRDLGSKLSLEGSGDELGDAIELAAQIGIDKDTLRGELVGVVLERALLWLIGDVRPDLNFAERRLAVTRRLRSLAPSLDVDPRESLVSALTSLQAAVAVASRKPTRESLSRMDEVTCLDRLRAQRFRCGVCGVPVRENAIRPSNRFLGGYEPVLPPTLDHTIPYYLVGNMTPYEILCRPCNQTKRDRLGVHEDGFVLAGNFLRRHESDRVRHRVAFWSLWTGRRCGRSGCEASAADGLMLVERISERSPFSLDNVRSVCDRHAEEGAWWLHMDVVTASRSMDEASEEETTL